MDRRKRMLFMIFILKKLKEKRRIRRNKRIFRQLILHDAMCNSYMQMLQIIGTTQSIPRFRSCQAYERRCFWFDDLWANRFDPHYHGGDRWMLDFRMRVDTFVKLVETFAPYLQKEDTVRVFAH